MPSILPQFVATSVQTDPSNMSGKPPGLTIHNLSSSLCYAFGNENDKTINSFEWLLDMVDELPNPLESKKKSVNQTSTINGQGIYACHPYSTSLICPDLRT